MDDQELAQRLARLEAKVDSVLMFTAKLESLLAAFMSGGRGKLLATLARGAMKGGDT